jgi:uncharacterized protein (TIGR03643 family)
VKCTYKHQFIFFCAENANELILEIKCNYKIMPHTFNLNAEDTDRLIEMAWEDRTSFEAIEWQFGLKQQDVIRLMRTQLKAASFKRWRKRTKGKLTKHAALRNSSIQRFKCSRQRTITQNKISKR